MVSVLLPRSARRRIHFTDRELTGDQFQQYVDADPAIPADCELCFALTRLLFMRPSEPIEVDILSRNPALHAAATDPRSTSATRLLWALDIGLNNPALGKEQLRCIDDYIATTMPSLPDNYSTEHFSINYTTNDPNQANNITAALAQSVGTALENAYTVFSATLDNTPYLNAQNSTTGKLTVNIWDFSSSAYGANAVDLGIIINSMRLNEKPGVQYGTPQHEVFHSIAFAYGFRTQFPSRGRDAWWSEGMATWAGLFASGYVSTPADVTDMLTTPDRDFYVCQYEAVPLWIFLQG